MKFKVRIEGVYAAELEVEEGNEQRAILAAQKRLGQYPLGTLPVCTITAASAEPTSLYVPPTIGSRENET